MWIQRPMSLVVGVALMVSTQVNLANASSLFPLDLPSKEWARFNAEGFDRPVCGVIYQSSDQLTNGMALGGLDTGCLDFESTGLLGYCTLFNTHVPRRGPLNTPVLGISAGDRTWVLCENKPKKPDGFTSHLVEVPPGELHLEGLGLARNIRYWGHYPVLDVEFETDAPVSVGLRAWSSFLPGDTTASMLPGIVFETHLRNVSPERQQGAIAFSFPGPLKLEAGSETFSREETHGAYSGILVRGNLGSYALGVLNNQSARFGDELGIEGTRWATLSKALPDASTDHSGTSVAVDFALDPAQEQTVRFVLTWCFPTWKGADKFEDGGYNWTTSAEHTFTHMYAKHYPDPFQTGRELARHHETLLRRILAWQQVVYAEEALPEWLRDSLINILYMITEDGFWAQKKPPVPDWVREEDGLFGLNECPRGCPQIECLPCSFYGSLPLTYFFPDLQLSTIRGYMGYMTDTKGNPPWTFGPRTELCKPALNSSYQAATNGISLAGIVDRFLLARDTPDKALSKEFYPKIKDCMTWTAGLRTTPSYTIGQRLISMPDADGHVTGLEWFELQQPGWFGMVSHIGTLHLAQLRITERLAREVGESEFADQCAEWIKAASGAMETYLWDKRGYYINFFKPETGDRSELVFGYMLDGEWILDHHGLKGALPQDHIQATLETIKRCNVALTQFGATNYANADGTQAVIPGSGQLVAESGYGTYSYFPPELLMLAMTYMYNGQREFGIELARKAWHNIICRMGYTWDLPNTMRGDADTGEKAYGSDYYQDMVLWSLPAAILGQDVAAPCKPGGLVNRILQAAKANAEEAKQ
jgi:uncharacterized protein (DUF608 family)